jgi:aryl-alcohol dehydrogenase-like predicted oxidoreductase
MIYRVPETEVIPLCADNGIRQIVWSPLGQGVLSGKYGKGVKSPGDSRAANPQMNYFMDRVLQKDLLAAIDRLEPIANELGISMSQLALAWVLRQPNLASAIIGASRPEQVVENTGASGIRLDESVLQAIDTALKGCSIA